MMDAKGWYWHEKARIRLGWWLFLVSEFLWFRPLGALTRYRVYAPDSRLWMTWASWGWLIDDLNQGDMPEHVRIGGLWR